MNLWTLPRSLELGGKEFPIRWGWQDVMAVLGELDADRPAWVCWFRAVRRFYAEEVPAHLLTEAAEKMSGFLTAGQSAQGGLKLMDWQQDALEIVADINRVAGREVRDENVHWWTFLGWFHAIGEGRLSELVCLRAKLARGEKLEPFEQEFYRRNRSRIRLQTEDEQAKRLKERLK